MAVAGGITFGRGDSGCGAVMDNESDVYWFHVDSISDPTNITLGSENPRPCKINHGYFFSNAQTAFTEVILNELSYLTPEEG